MLNRPDSEPVVPIVVVLRIDTTTVEVQVASIAGRVERRRPVVAVRTAIVPTRTIAVARASKKELSVTALHDHQKGLHTAKPFSIFDFSRYLLK